MVAETANLPSPKPAKKTHFGPGNPIPLSTRLTVRSFYVIQGLKPSQIAPMVGLATQQVANLVRTQGWTKLRAEKASQKESSAIQRQDAHAEQQVTAIHKAIAVRTEELSVRTLDHCAQLLESPHGSEKEIQMASGAAMNFVKIARMSRGLDSRNGNSDTRSGDSPTVNVFLVRGETLERSEQPMKHAESIPVEVKTLPASQ